MAKAKGEHKGAMRAALRHRDFRFLIAGQTISGIGDWLYNVSLIVYVLTQTHSGGWVAAASIARLLPYALFSTFGGMIADRYDRKKVMIIADLGRFVVMAGLTLVAHAQGPVLLAMLLAAMSTTFSSAYMPCVNASTPALVGEEDLTAANAIISTILNVSLAVGPAIGGLLLILGSTTVAFGVNAVTFLLSALCTIPIRTKLTTVAEEAEAESPFVERLKQGFIAIGTSPEVILLVALSVVLTFSYGEEIVLYALAATHLLGIGDQGVAFMYAAIGIGGIAAAGFTGRLGRHPKQGLILVTFGLISAFPMMLLAFAKTPAQAYGLLAIEGAAVIVVDVVAITMLQRLLRPEVMGRVFGILDSLMVATILIGSLFAPLVVGLTSLQAALVIAGSLVLIFTLLILPRARGIDRKTAERVAMLEPRIDLLERVGMFEAATRQMLEALAGAVAEERALAGTVIIHEGAEADDLFAVSTGTVEVTTVDASGAVVKLAELGEADYFGEIGILERVPRTATVAALTDCDLYRITGEDFLRISNEGSLVSGNVRATMSRRMARIYPVEEEGLA